MSDAPLPTPSPRYVWERLGLLMRTNPDLMKSVVFLGVQTERDGFTPIGTGFVLTHQFDEKIQFIFVATAAHVVENLTPEAQKRVVVRVNKKDGGVGYVSTAGRPRLTHEDSANDIMLLSVALDPTIYDIIAVPGDRDEVEAMRAKGDGTLPGDSIAVTGVYTSHHGLVRNIPVLRTGNIAAVADEPVLTSRGYAIAHLIELRTIAGLSGSPVYQTSGPVRIRNGAMETRVQDTSEGTILGVLVGYHLVEDETDVISVPRQARPATVDEQQYSADERNTGFGVVIPIERVFEIIERPDVRKICEQVVASMRSKAGYREADG